jgi:hypothetical protein
LEFSINELLALFLLLVKGIAWGRDDELLLGNFFEADFNVYLDEGIEIGIGI